MEGPRSGAAAFLRRFAWEHGHADVWRVFDDAEAFSEVVNALAEPWRAERIAKVCGIEARGFVLAGAVAYALDAGFVAIRKRGNLFPGTKHQVEAAPEYRGTSHVLQIQQRSIGAGEGGSQAVATRRLIQTVRRCPCWDRGPCRSTRRAGPQPATDHHQLGRNRSAGDRRVATIGSRVVGNNQYLSYCCVTRIVPSVGRGWGAWTGRWCRSAARSGL